MRKAIQILIVPATAFTVYFNALSNGFVYDDSALILQNPWITDAIHIKDIFLNNQWGFVGFKSNYYRPMMHILYMFCYHLFGLEAWGFHLVNIGLHAGASILVLLLVSRLGFSFPIPLMAGILFAVHPIHTEAVTWVAGITDTSMTFFGLLSLYLFMLSKKGRLQADRYYIFSILAFFAALFCKEPALMILGIIFSYDYAYNKTEESGILGSARRLAPFAVVAGVYLVIRYFAVGGVAPRNWNAGLSALDVVINVPPLFARYLLKLLFPVDLNIYHTYTPLTSMMNMEFLFSIAVLSAYLLVCMTVLKREKAVFLGMCIIVWPLLTSFYIPALDKNIFAERYLHLPSVGFVLIIASAIARLWHIRWGIILASLMSVVIVCSYSVGTISRNGVFRDDLSLWLDTVRKSPDAAVPHKNLGSVFLGMPGFEGEAINQFKLATKLDPAFDSAFNDLGIAYLRSGQTDDAIKAFESSVKISPANPTFHNNLGIALQREKIYDRAVFEFETALNLDPSNETIRKNLSEIIDEARRRP